MYMFEPVDKSLWSLTHEEEDMKVPIYTTIYTRSSIVGQPEQGHCMQKPHSAAIERNPTMPTMILVYLYIPVQKTYISTYQEPCMLLCFPAEGTRAQACMYSSICGIWPDH